MWYLSEDLVGLALFDNNVSVQTKNEMVTAMKIQERAEFPPKRANLDSKTLDATTTLVDFTTDLKKKSSPSSVSNKIFWKLLQLNGGTAFNTSKQRQY